MSFRKDQIDCIFKVRSHFSGISLVRFWIDLDLFG